LINDSLADGGFRRLADRLQLIFYVLDAVNTDLTGLRKETDVLTEKIESHEDASEISFRSRKEANGINIPEVADPALESPLLVEVAKDNLAQETGSKGALRNAVVVVDPLISCSPNTQPISQGLGKLRVAPQGAKHVPKNTVVQAVVACCQVEAGGYPEAICESLPCGFVEGFVPVAPPPIEPRARLAGVEVAKDLNVVAVLHLREESLGDEVDGSLVDDLVVDG
jgi:hypothetical protein